MATVPPTHQSLLVKFHPDCSERERMSIIAQYFQGRLVRWLPQIQTAVIHVPKVKAASILSPQVVPEGSVDHAKETASWNQVVTLILNLFRLLGGQRDKAADIHPSQPAAPPADSVLKVEADGIVSACADGSSPTESGHQHAEAKSNDTVVRRSVDDPDLEAAYALEQIRAVEAWEKATGRGVTVAIVDTGIDQSHPEFSDRILPGFNFVADNQEIQDDNGHGTHVAGIVGAAFNNGQGAAGVAPNCMLLPVKVLDESNLGFWSDVAAGLLYALEEGAHVINLSLGASSTPPDAVQEAIALAVQSAVVVAAAGNSAVTTPFYPASYEGVVAVAATDHQGSRWGASNYGDWITLAAPGENIFSTANGQQYEFRSGTSMAAAFVSGVASLVREENAQDPAEIVRQMSITARPVEGTSVPSLGAGRVDALGALEGGQNIFLPFIASHSS